MHRLKQGEGAVGGDTLTIDFIPVSVAKSCVAKLSVAKSTYTISIYPVD